MTPISGTDWTKVGAMSASFDVTEFEYDGSDLVAANDPKVLLARGDLLKFFRAHRTRVFYTKQVEILFEKPYFHWVTNRALHSLIEDGDVRTESASLATGAPIKLLWHKSFRHYKRAAARVVELVDQYSDPQFGHLLGYTGEMLTQEAFARGQFKWLAREVREWNGKRWDETNHNLDFLFERDSQLYGVEIKNALSYMDDSEWAIKTRIAQHLGASPIFVVRMAPKTWINDLQKVGGFTLVLKWHLYPRSHVELARAVKAELELPVDTPPRLLDSTVQRLVNWHEARLRKV